MSHFLQSKKKKLNIPISNYQKSSDPPKWPSPPSTALYSHLIPVITSAKNSNSSLFLPFTYFPPHPGFFDRQTLPTHSMNNSGYPIRTKRLNKLTTTESNRNFPVLINHYKQLTLFFFSRHLDILDRDNKFVFSYMQNRIIIIEYKFDTRNNTHL